MNFVFAAFWHWFLRARNSITLTNFTFIVSNFPLLISLHPSNINPLHYSDVIIAAMAYQITRITIVYSTIYSDADQRKHQNSLAFVRGIHRWPVNSPHKWPLTRKMFPFDDVIMRCPTPTSLRPQMSQQTQRCHLRFGGSRINFMRRT